MDKAVALKNLEDIRDTLIDLYINYFLIDGTLLGLVRNNDFLDHDTDTDMGVNFKDFGDGKKLAELKAALKSKGFTISGIFGDWTNNFQISFARHGVKTDLFFYRRQGDEYIFHSFLHDEVITYSYPFEMLDVVTRVEFKGSQFTVPKYSDQVLRHKYGKDWHIKKENWDWAYHPRNIVTDKPIIFTVGCFDMLHEGHLNLFDKMAAEIGAVSYSDPNFYVFIHDDFSILKNKGRVAVQSLAQRSANLDLIHVLNSIEVNHADPTYEIREFIEDHPGRKFIFMRGDDWQDFPGRAYLEEMNIPIKFINYTEGVSSSLLREKL